MNMETSISLSDGLSVDIAKYDADNVIHLSISLKRGSSHILIDLSETLWDRIAQSVSAELSSEPEPQ
jgi:hypothetical protein